MNQDNLRRLKSLHGRYYHSSVDILPDGWFDAIIEFFEDLTDISELDDVVSVRFERCPDGLRAFIFPEMSRWHPHQIADLRTAQRVLLLTTRQVPASDPGEQLRSEYPQLLSDAIIDLPDDARLIKEIREMLRRVQFVIDADELHGRLRIISMTIVAGHLTIRPYYSRALTEAPIIDIDSIVHSAEYVCDRHAEEVDDVQALTADEFVTYIRRRYARLCDPSWTDQDFQYFLAVNQGWHKLIDEYLRRAEEVVREHDLQDRYYLRQIKEKLGELRIYFRPVEKIVGIDEERRDIVEIAETLEEASKAIAAIYDDIRERSVHTCEVCGEAGEWRNEDGWFTTLCDRHLAESRERRGQ